MDSVLVIMILKIRTVHVVTTENMISVAVVYIRNLESKPTRSRDFLLRRLVINLALVRVQCSPL